MAGSLERAMVSVNRLEHRISDFPANRWVLDSGAFSRVFGGRGHMPELEYAQRIERWAACGTLEAAVSQDYMCEPIVLARTGLSTEEHQARTTRSYLRLRELTGVYVMPVLQGYEPEEYVRHLRELSPELPEGAWTGVGSLCKRQGSPARISAVLTAILRERPDLKLHGFGVKTTSLRRRDLWERFHSVDSMAWSAGARRRGQPGDRNSARTCLEWTRKLENTRPEPSQISML
jgi:hypothetical protein